MHLFVHGITAFRMSLGLAYKRSMAQRMEKIQGLPRPVQDSGHWNRTHNLHLPTTLQSVYTVPSTMSLTPWDAVKNNLHPCSPTAHGWAQWLPE